MELRGRAPVLLSQQRVFDDLLLAALLQQVVERLHRKCVERGVGLGGQNLQGTPAVGVDSHHDRFERAGIAGAWPSSLWLAAHLLTFGSVRA
jgi:hypothetical protein